MSDLKKEPILFCVVGPTASGKSTVCQELKDSVDNLQFSISTTTRDPRPGEKEGVDYFFVSKDEFQKRLDNGDFLEHAEYSGNHYGTEKRNLDLAAKAGNDLLLEIEVQGIQQIKSILGEQVVTVFIFPVSFEVLERRLRDRKTESEEQIQRRLEIAKDEVKILSDTNFSDYLVLNREMGLASKRVEAIIEAERHRISRYKANYLTSLNK